MAQLHTIIRNKRKLKGFTQKELANELNVSDKTISKWETGRGTPDITMVKRLSSVLGISPSVFLDDNIGFPDESDDTRSITNTETLRSVGQSESIAKSRNAKQFKPLFIVASVLLIPFLFFSLLIRHIDIPLLYIYFMDLRPWLQVFWMIFTLLLLFSSVLVIGIGFMNYKNTKPHHSSKSVYVMIGLYIVLLMAALDGIFLPFLWGARTFHISLRYFPSSFWPITGLIILQGMGIALFSVFKLKLKRDRLQSILFIITGIVLLMVLILMAFPNLPEYYQGPYLQRIQLILSPLNQIGPFTLPSLFLYFNILLRIVFMRVSRIESYDTPEPYALNHQ